MKRLVLRPWAEKLVMTIAAIALLFMGSECEDLGLFILSHLIAAVVLILTALVLNKYGREVND